MRSRTITIAGLISVATVVGVVSWASAGQLNPPQGPIRATGPITINGADVNNSLPYLIMEPGSYILTSNIEAPDGHTGSGIKIYADNVTLDLNGFAVIGVLGSKGGVEVTSGKTNIAIANGTLRGWGWGGVTATTAGDSLFSKLRLTDNGSGLWAGVGSTVQDCLAQGNTEEGIGISTGCTVINCLARENGANGFSIGSGSVVRDCVATDNTLAGFRVDMNSIMTNCLSRSNDGHGITQLNIASGGTTLRGCRADSNGGAGILVGGSSIVVNCTVRYNHGDGGIIIDGGGGLVSGCTAQVNNYGDGIRVGWGCSVLDNVSSMNGAGSSGAGIHVTGGANRIEGNSVYANYGQGILVDLGGNLIIRNWATGNDTEYSMVGGNTVGMTVNMSNITTNDNPHANYEQ